MSPSQIGAAAIIVASAVLPYLLTQPDYVFPALVKVLLGAANVGVAALALYLKVKPAE